MTLISTTDDSRALDAPRLVMPLRLRHWACVIALASADVVAFVLAVLVFRSSHAMPRFLAADLFTLIAAAFIFVEALRGDYSRRQPFWEAARSTVGALLVAALPDLAALGTGGGHAPAHQILSWVFLLVAIPLARHAMRRILRALGLWQRRAALIGAGQDGASAHASLATSLSLGLDIRALVRLNGAGDVTGALAQLKRVDAQTSADIAGVVQQGGFDIALIVGSEVPANAFPDLVKSFSEAGVEIAFIPWLGGIPLGNLTSSIVFGRNILLFQFRDNLSRWPLRAVKRLFDVLLSAALLVLLAPLFAALALLIRSADGGPATYRQTRVGRGGTPFACRKFRTMAMDADARLERWRIDNPALYAEYQQSFKLKDDPRVTPMGHFLRRTSLDELPQLVNVLAGEMSLVGPRPVVARELAEHYGPAGKLYARVRPGMTGVWQISGRSDTTYAERIAYDEWYILNWSMWHDIVILIETARVVVSGRGAV